MNTLEKMQSKIFIEPSDNNPEVILNSKSGVIKFTGRSMPSNTDEFYEPILEWIKIYAQKPVPLTSVECFIDYYDSRSSKYFFSIMRELGQIYHTGNKLNIKWLYEEEDSESLDFAELMEAELKIIIQKEAVAEN